MELADAPRPGGLRDSLADAFGDPDLQLLYRTDENEWVRPTAQPACRARDDATQLVAATGRRRADRPAGLLDDPALRDELSSAARLALEHERLQAAARKQLADLRASRARLVAAGDTERRRLERDLHDGAQQRLVSVAISLGLAARAGDAELAWAQRELRPRSRSCASSPTASIRRARRGRARRGAEALAEGSRGCGSSS